MYYVYVLQSKKDNGFYTGYTLNLKSRLEAHKRGYVSSTKHRRPFELIYYEASIKQRDALQREKYLKTYYGTMFLKKRLKFYFTDRDVV